jgi:hypothetical protein
MAETAADLIAEMMIDAGIQRDYGVAGEYPFWGTEMHRRSRPQAALIRD